MRIDPGTFFVLVGTLAAGGVAGYAAGAKRMEPALDRALGRPPEAPPAPPAPPPPPVVDAGAAAAPPVVDAGPPEPACDDSVGTVGECPPPGFPTVEGGCGSYAHTRCGEFKRAMKPRVAAAAVECLNKLKPQERCDANRVNLCGHLALMNACPEKTTLSECDTVTAACGPSPIAPSSAECRQTFSGLNDQGRKDLALCMRTHCFDKGLLGCVAVPSPPK